MCQHLFEVPHSNFHMGIFITSSLKDFICLSFHLFVVYLLLVCVFSWRFSLPDPLPTLTWTRLFLFLSGLFARLSPWYFYLLLSCVLTPCLWSHVVLLLSILTLILLNSTLNFLNKGAKVVGMLYEFSHIEMFYSSLMLHQWLDWVQNSN